MTQLVTLPNGDTMEFPDDMQPKTMEAFVKNTLAKSNVSTGADIAKSLAYAPGKAVTGLAGLPGDVRDLVRLGKDKLSGYMPDWVNQADKAMSLVNPMTYLAPALPTSGELRGAAEKVTGPWYDPQTRQGKIADTATQAATTFGRSLITQPAKAVPIIAAITGGTEGAGALTEDNPWARAAGGLLGGGIPAFMQALRSRPGAILKDALGNVLPGQIDAGIAQQNAAKALGIPLMGTESLDLGHQFASAVMAHPSGNADIQRFLSQRPQQVESAVNRGLIGTTGPRQSPTANATRAQQAADATIQNAEDAVSKQSGPLYKASANDQVPEAWVADLVNRAKGVAAADKTGILAPIANEFASRLSMAAPNVPLAGAGPQIFKTIDRAIIENPQPKILRTLETAAADSPHSYAGRPVAPSMDLAVPMPEHVTDIGNLDRARKYFRDKMDLPPFAADAIPKEASGTVSALNAALADIMGQASPQWNQARQLHQTLSKQTVEPLLAGDVGKIAGRGFDPAVSPAVPRILSTVADSAVARPETIRTLYTHLNAQDKTAFPGIVQTHLENQLNTAMADVRTGGNPTAGAKFRQAIAGTPQDQANFNEMMRGVAQANGQNPDAVVAGANNLLKTLELTGRTPGIGSPTQGRGEISKEMGKTILGDTLSTVSLTPTKPLARRFDDWVQRGRYEDMAKALTAPDSVQQLVKMAKLDPKGLTAKYYLASLLGLDRAIPADGQ